jgi:predicted metal-dependent hydrolase
MKTWVKTTKPLLLGRFEITLGNQVVSYSLKRSPRARLIWLQIHSDKGLSITVPRHYNLDELPAYLVSKSRWILRHLSGRQTQLPLSETDTSAFQLPVHYQGLPLQLSGENHNMTYRLPDGSTADQDTVFIWLRQQSLVVIPSKVQQYSHKIGVSFNKICIRDQKTRWGSCSQVGNLNFNWRLIMAPEPVLNYVVIHELCHIKRMSHGKSFWNIVAKYCPEWKEMRRWLNKHSRELHHFHSSSA